MVRNGIAAYQQADVNTADPLKLVIMCYDGAISHLRIARDSIVARELERKADAFDRASDFIGELNRALDFDRAQAFGMRLDRPSGTGVRFDPGVSVEVDLVAFGGTGEVHGFGGLTNGLVSDDAVRERALQRARAAGYRGA